MPRHWVHSDEPFGKKKTSLFSSRMAHHHALIRSASPQNLDSTLLLFKDRRGCEGREGTRAQMSDANRSTPFESSLTLGASWRSSRI